MLGDTETLAVLSVLIIGYLFYQKKIKEIVFYIFLMSSGIILTLSLKLLLKRDRPGDVEYIDFWGLGNDIVSYSFPSGHALKVLLLFGFLIWLLRPTYHWNKYSRVLTSALVLGIVFCGIGQLFLNEHYISDVIGGYLIGFTILSFSLWGYTLWIGRMGLTNDSYRIVEKTQKEELGK